MAQYSLNAYDADVFIPEFRGLMQYGDPTGGDLRYSPDCLNIETVGGVLQPVPARRSARVNATFSGQTTMMYYKAMLGASAMSVQVGGKTGVSVAPENPWDCYLIATDGKLYAVNVLGDLISMTGNDVQYTPTLITMPSGVTSFSSCKFDWTTYEIVVRNSVITDPDIPVNILIFTNEEDGVFMLQGATLTKINNSENKLPNFTCVTRFADRIWGARDDTVYYSRAFKADDWSDYDPITDADPADAGGTNRLATFDDDKIVAMKPFGDSLIIFSKKRAWKVTGSDPSNFIWQEQFGNGCLYPDTIAVMGNRIVMLGEEGLVAYDGYQVVPFLRQQTNEMFKKVNIPYLDYRAACIGNKYLLTACGEALNLSSRTFNVSEEGELETPETIDLYTGKEILVYDADDGSVTLRTPAGNGAKTFCGDKPYYIDERVVRDGAAYLIMNEITRIDFNAWDTGSAIQETKWVSPWITFGRQDIKKGGFDLYFTPEIKAPVTADHQYWELTSPMSGYPVYKNAAAPATYKTVFRISIQTEKKTKTKTYTVNSLSAADISAGKQYRMKRLHFGGSGRRFRLIIETRSTAGQTHAPWRLVGGIHIIAETDKD